MTDQGFPSAGEGDTIAAVATPPGRGGVGIVRVSGPAVPAIARAMLGHDPQPRHAAYGAFLGTGGEVLDRGIALYFPAPNSYTGEHVLELQGHGGPVVLDRLLRRALALGARPARPGEFTERAFLNGKLDLAQAEAVADLIDSASEEAARSALRALEGAFSRQIDELVERLTRLRVYVEGAIDFPEEEIDFLADDTVIQRLDALRKELDALLEEAHQGCLLREGMQVALAGPPNAGKSSLLNRLAQRDAAIVTEIPGTTRDVLREAIDLDGLPLHVSDTAGLRESGDPVERLGVQRAREEISRADHVLLVVDDTDPEKHDTLRRLLGELPQAVLPAKRTVVCNKIDLSGAPPALRAESLGGEREAVLYLSAKSGAGMELLRERLKETMGYRRSGEGRFMARRRHLDALHRARECLARGRHQLLQFGAGELLAEELRQAQQALGEITGQVHADELLGRIFSAFCIGK